MGVQAGDAEQVTPDRGGADLLGRGDPSTGEAPLLSEEACTVHTRPGRAGTKHLPHKLNRGTWKFLPVHIILLCSYMRIVLPKSFIFNTICLKGKNVGLLKGLLRSEGLLSIGRTGKTNSGAAPFFLESCFPCRFLVLVLPAMCGHVTSW